MDDDGGFRSGVRLVVTGLVSAVMTATLVIAVGQTLLGHPPSQPVPASPVLAHAAR